MRYLYVMLWSCFFWSSLAFADNETTHIDSVKGTTVLTGDVSVNQAQQQALYKAWAEAIKKACGVTISGFQSMKDGMYAGEYIEAVSNGYIMNYEKLDQDCDKRHRPEDDDWIWSCWVEISAEVRCIEGNRTFSVSCELNKSAYEAGEELIITVNPTEKAYITVFNIAANDQVYVLYPHGYSDDLPFMANMPNQEIPNVIDRDYIHFYVEPLKTHDSDVEYIKVLATKRPLDLNQWTQQKANARILKGEGVITLGKLIAQIPLEERAEDMAQYIVSQKQ